MKLLGSSFQGAFQPLSKVFLLFSNWGFHLCPSGGEDSHSLDGSRGHRIQEVHISQRRVELRGRHVGSDVVWREAVLGHVQPGRRFESSRRLG